MPTTHVGPDQTKLLDEIQTLLNNAKRIVAITGAGISTNCGIPDFRSKEGLYSLINSEYNSRIGAKQLSASSLKGKDLFSSSVWQDEDSTSVFYTFIASLRQKIQQEVKATSQTHKLIRRIRDQKKLLRCYTQNIDGLEARDGLSMQLNRGKGSRSRFTKKSIDLPNFAQHSAPAGKLDGGCEVVQLHGELDSVRCTMCQRIRPWSSTEEDAFLRGEAPICQDCELEDIVRQAAGKRGSAIGTLRPNIVLYGESNPMETEIGSILSHDLTFGPDLLLIMGTSLKVHGLKTIVKEFAKAVHSKKTGKVIFVNLSEAANSTWKDVIDYWVEMDCDEWAKDKMRLKQKEITFKALKKSTTIVSEKENIPSTPAPKRFLNAGNLPTPPSTKRKRVLVELDPISGSRAQPETKARLSSVKQGRDAIVTPRSSKRHKMSSDFEIWQGQDTGKDQDVVIELSPLKDRKRKLM